MENQTLQDIDYKSLKQKYLREHIMEQGYDVYAFSDYLKQKKEKGDDIDQWDLQELIREVQIFKEQQQKPRSFIKRKLKQLRDTCQQIKQ